MKNLPFHGAARRSAAFPAFRRSKRAAPHFSARPKRAAANKKRTAQMTVRCTYHFGFGNGKTNRHGAQRI